MLNLLDKNVGYLIVSPFQSRLSDVENLVELSKIQSILYSREYSLISLTGYCGGNWDKSYIAYNDNHNELLREDATFLLKNTAQSEVVIKYKNEEFLKLLSETGAESLLSMHGYSENVTESKIYIYNGFYFTLRPEKKYKLIESKSDLKSGMKVEYYNNEKWNEKVVQNIDLEYENMYKLLIKYNKLRIESD